MRQSRVVAYLTGISFLPVTISILDQYLSLLPKLQKKFSLWQRNNLVKLPNPDVKKFEFKMKSGRFSGFSGFHGVTTQHSSRFSPNSELGTKFNHPLSAMTSHLSAIYPLGNSSMILRPPEHKWLIWSIWFVCWISLVRFEVSVSGNVDFWYEGSRILKVARHKEFTSRAGYFSVARPQISFNDLKKGELLLIW